MKLTNQHRKEIIAACLKATFAQRDAAYEAQRTELAEAIYQHKHGLYEAIANKLPQGWLDTTGTMEIERAGFSRHTAGACKSQLKMSKHRRVPAFSSGKYEIVGANHPLADQADAVLATFDSLKSDKEALESRLTGVLASATTLAKLQVVWPEGAAFFPVEPPKVTAVVPFELAAEVNKIMGLAPIKEAA